jgi:hypothetical protein
MANSPPFAASNSFVETPLRRMAFQTGLFGKTLVLLTDEDIIEFMSEWKGKKGKRRLDLLLKSRFFCDSSKFELVVYEGMSIRLSPASGMRSELF